MSDPEEGAPDAAAPDPALDPALAAASGPIPCEPPPEPELEPEAALAPDVETEPEPEATGGALRESGAPHATAMHDSMTTTQHRETTWDDRSFQNNANLRGTECRLSPLLAEAYHSRERSPEGRSLIDKVHRLNDQRKLTA